tara:strand:- start:3651 stop:4553 length:903 start_codon:yes stop_codon:yes gene_type:complete
MSINNKLAQTCGRIIILGHTGYIGRSLFDKIIKIYPEKEVVGLSDPDCDLTNKSDLKSLLPYLDQQTIVIMCSGIKKQHGDNIENFSKNMEMIINVCSCIEKNSVNKFLYFSSAEVYGEAIHNTKINEQTAVQPSSYYGIAKYASEILLKKTFEKANNNNLTILRPVLVYGPSEIGTYYGPSGFVKHASAKETITLWGDGKELREFLYIDDLVKIVMSLTFNDYSGTINITAGKSYTFRQSIEYIRKYFPNLDIIMQKRTKGKVDQGYDNRALLEVLPKLHFTTLEAGIDKLINYDLNLE